MARSAKNAIRVTKFPNGNFANRVPPVCSLAIKNAEKRVDIDNRGGNDMNKIWLMGYIGRDPEMRYTKGAKGDIAIAGFTLAVRRKQEDTDWFNVTAFGKTAENICKYFKKGSRIAICGRVQTGSYEGKDGIKRARFDVIAEEFAFTESKQKEQTAGKEERTKGYSGLGEIIEGWDETDDELPF